MNEEFYIISGEIRIGFFNNLEDSQKALKLTNSGYILSKKQWEDIGIGKSSEVLVHRLSSELFPS